MWTRKDLKSRGKAAFKSNYWASVLAGILLTALTAGATAAVNGKETGTENVPGTTDLPMQQVSETLNNLDTMVIIGIAAAVGTVVAVSLLLNIFVFNPLKVGCYAFFRENVAEGNGDLNLLKVGFQSYRRSFLTLLLRDVFLILWTCLLIIPGLVKSYSYRMVPFIIRDNPDLAPREVINRSRQMMDGQKWAAFKLDLSFLGWYLLSALTLGIFGVFWTYPYFYNTNAALYLAVCGDDAPSAAGVLPERRRPEKPAWEL